MIDLCLPELEIWVSIPAGFSDALRPGLGICFMFQDTVSIPAGFSDALRHRASFIYMYDTKFQSLLGFLMRCDPEIRTAVDAAYDGFNPCWVF